MSDFLGQSELQSESHDKRNQLNDENTAKFSKMSECGLKMAKKRNHFKEMQKANERMITKRGEEIKLRRSERIKRAEENARLEFEVTSKEQIRKEHRKNEKHEKKLIK